MEQQIPRLPIDGSLDLTYRCNNHCRHCWLRQPSTATEQQRELSFDAWRCIIDQARALGARRWSISGGEPMLRPDFPEIFDYLTRKCVSYTLNTNGTLITPEIAHLLTRTGGKMVALYGATAEVYDHVTRHPGGFEAAMRGMAYLREAGANFIVQLIPLRDNFHQWDEMRALAQSLSPHFRLGASWLHLSACADPAVNAEIARQRLDPAAAVALAAPRPDAGAQATCGACATGDDRLYADCITEGQSFHVDPYGGMSFCSFVKDPALRYDLCRGTVQEAWEAFIPSLAETVHGGQEYREHCGACEQRADCHWCPVYGYLEHGRHAAPVDYLCAVAEETRCYRDAWLTEHRRFYRIAGITLQVESDLPITDATFAKKFDTFRVDGPGDETIIYRHHSPLPKLRREKLGREIYHKPPWAIYRRDGGWTYLGIPPTDFPDEPMHLIINANDDHTEIDIYHPDKEIIQRGHWHSLSMMVTDQILLGALLPLRDACYLHAAGAIMDGQGLLFVGHSEAGKTTTTRMIADRAEILCDDRIIVRRWPEGFRAHGTWSHGESPQVSAADAPLSAILFLEQATENCLIPLTDRKDIISRLLPCVIKPLVTAEWWDRVLSLLERLVAEVPCYRMRFDKSGNIVPLLPPNR